MRQAEASCQRKGDGLPGSIPQLSSTRNPAKRRSPENRASLLESRSLGAQRDDPLYRAALTRLVQQIGRGAFLLEAE
jgi:hypothetical protein